MSLRSQILVSVVVLGPVLLVSVVSLIENITDGKPPQPTGDKSIWDLFEKAKNLGPKTFKLATQVWRHIQEWRGQVHPKPDSGRSDKRRKRRKQPADTKPSSSSDESGERPGNSDSSSESDAPSKSRGKPDSSSDGPSTSSTTSSTSSSTAERYSCEDLLPNAPAGAYKFPLRPEFRSPGFDSVLFYCAEGRTSILNPYDPVPQYDPWTSRKLKDSVRMPPHIPKLKFDKFAGDKQCLDPNSPEGCANHVKPLGVMRVADGSHHFVLRWERCSSCAVSFEIEFPNYMKARQLNMIGFVFSTRGHPAVLSVNEQNAFSVLKCDDTNAFMNEEDKGCCGYNSCFVNTYRQPYNSQLEKNLPEKPEHATGYPFPQVYFNSTLLPLKPKAANVSVMGRAPESVKITMFGKSGGACGGNLGVLSCSGGGIGALISVQDTDRSV